MTSNHRRLALVAAAIVLGACSGTANTGGTPPPVQASVTATVVPQATASTAPATEQPVASGVAGGSAPPTAIDPCSLITSAEASTTIGMKLGAGKDVLVSKNRECVFESGVTRVSLILAPPAPDAATAQSYYDAARAQVPAGITVDDVSGVGDRASYGTGSAAGMSISALFVLKGTQGFDLYCQFPGCSETASLTEAQLVVGRLP